MTTPFLVLSTLLTFLGCKIDDQGSEGKVDRTVAELTYLSQFDPDQKEEICSQRTMITFIGNAESALTKKLTKGSRSKATSTRKRDRDRHSKFFSVFTGSAERLRNALTKTDCSRSWSRRENAGRVLFVEILDGPKYKDSTINSDWYHWSRSRGQWVKEDTVSWHLDQDRNLARTSADKKWEIHLPTEVSGVLEKFITLTAKNEFSGTKRFHQAIYLVKSHGGRVRTDASASPSLQDFFADNGKLPEDTAHLTLFDPHGPKEEVYMAQVYSPYWRKATGCRLVLQQKEKMSARINELRGQDNAQADRLAERLKRAEKKLAKCKTYIAESSSSDLGADGDNSLGADGDNSLGADGDNSLGADGDNSLGADGDNSLGADGDNSLGADGDNSLGADGDNSLGADGDNSLGADGDNSLGADGDNSLGADGDNSLGAEKYMMYVKAAKIGDRASLDMPDGNEIVAAAASYDSNVELDGVSELTFPVGTKTSSPTMVFLDSCYQNSEIDRRVKSVLIDSDDKKHKVVFFSNPHSMEASIVDYGALNASRYVTLPFVFKWASDKEDPLYSNDVRVLAEEIEKHISSEGLDFIESLQTRAHLMDKLKRLQAQDASAEEIDKIKSDIQKIDDKLDRVKKDRTRRTFATKTRVL